MEICFITIKMTYILSCSHYPCFKRTEIFQVNYLMLNNTAIIYYLENNKRNLIAYVNLTGFFVSLSLSQSLCLSVSLSLFVFLSLTLAIYPNSLSYIKVPKTTTKCLHRSDICTFLFVANNMRLKLDRKTSVNISSLFFWHILFVFLWWYVRWEVRGCTIFFYL